MKLDPFGYYSKRLTAETPPQENFPYFEDYPMNDNHWSVGEIFESGNITVKFLRPHNFLIDFDDSPESTQAGVVEKINTK